MAFSRRSGFGTCANKLKRPLDFDSSLFHTLSRQATVALLFSSPDFLVVREERGLANLNWAARPSAIRILSNKNLNHASRRRKLKRAAASTALMASTLAWAR